MAEREDDSQLKLNRFPNYLSKFQLQSKKKRGTFNIKLPARVTRYANSGTVLMPEKQNGAFHYCSLIIQKEQ